MHNLSDSRPEIPKLAQCLITTMSAKYPQRSIGNDSVSAIGLGCMGMSFVYTSSHFNDEESYKVLTMAADAGITFWDTADMYGPFTYVSS